MKRPVGELVQFDFYFHQRSCEDALREVVRYFLGQGGLLSGEIIVAQIGEGKGSRMTSVYSEATVEKTINEQGLWEEFHREGFRVVTVGMWNAIGTSKKVPDIITFAGVSKDAPPDEPNPVSVVSEGWVFSTPGYEHDRNKLARRLHDHFVKACDSIKPTYAAILNEDSLASPHDLRNGKGHWCFANFYISRSDFGQEVLARVESLYSNAFCQPTEHGLYVSTWMFSPKNIANDGKAIHECSSQVARILGESLNRQGKAYKFDS